MESIPQPVDIPSRSITTLPALLSSLSGLQSREAALSASLTDLLSASEPLTASLSRIQALVPTFEEIHNESTIFSAQVYHTAQTAERVGGKVKILDEEIKRVREAADRVGQVMELKLALASLQTAIDSQDWESASRHCAKAMSIPTEVISGPFAETIVPTSEFPLPPVQTLQNARETLLSVFCTKFREASQSGDAATTSRFFKLFPVIGWEEEGLQAYSSFVVDLMRTRVPTSAKTSSPMYYITMLTSLFEGIARIVDQHQPIVEKYYGRGKMFAVVKSLLEECDRVVKRLVDGWEEERALQRKLTQTSNPVFLFLSPRSRKQSSTSPDDEMDPREVDRLLSELAGMAGRWGLFRRFLYDRLKEDPNVDSISAPSGQDGLKAQDSPVLRLIQACSTTTVIEDLLSRYYLPLEIWYFRVTTDKAHSLSTPDLSHMPPTTTTPDDFFYILKTVMHRLASTSSLLAVQRMAVQVKDVVSRDYAFVIKKRLEDVYKHANLNATSPQRDRTEKELKLMFITYLNDLDISSSHMERLVKDLLGSSVVSQNFLDLETSPVTSHISSLLDLILQFQAILRSGVEQLFNQLARPRLRSLITDVYKDVTYMLDDDAYSLAEAQDIVRKRFIRSWEALMDGFKDVLTDANYSMFIHLVVDILVRPWEKLVTGMKFTELGAIRFDRDVRSVLGYLSSQTKFGDGREKFQRLQQISTLLNLDVEEDGDEFYNNSGINWRLSLSEARMIIALRV